MKSDQFYRVGVLVDEGDQEPALFWLTRDAVDRASVIGLDDFSVFREGAEALPLKFAWGWVQLLSAFHQSVLVERVEVARG